MQKWAKRNSNSGLLRWGNTHTSSFLCSEDFHSVIIATGLLELKAREEPVVLSEG